MGCKQSKVVILGKPTPEQNTLEVNLEIANNSPSNATLLQENSNNSPDAETDISKLTGQKRILRELKYFNEDAPTNMRMDPQFDGSNLKEWRVNIDGAKGTIYEGDKFKLKIVFNEGYPRKAPTITFIPGHVPKHPHIYSNGHMCLQILYEAYEPRMTLVYICNCIMLLLDRNTKKEWPYNDASYLIMGVNNPNHGMWWWEDTL